MYPVMHASEYPSSSVNASLKCYLCCSIVVMIQLHHLLLEHLYAVQLHCLDRQDSLLMLHHSVILAVTIQLLLMLLHHSVAAPLQRCYRCSTALLRLLHNAVCCDMLLPAPPAPTAPVAATPWAAPGPRAASVQAVKRRPNVAARHKFAAASSCCSQAPLVPER